MDALKKWVYVARFDGKRVRKFTASVENLYQYKWISHTKFQFPYNDGRYCEGIILHSDVTITVDELFMCGKAIWLPNKAEKYDKEILQEEIEKKNFRCPHNAFHPFPDQDAKLKPEKLADVLKNSQKRHSKKSAHDHSLKKHENRLSMLNIGMDENSMSQESVEENRNSTPKEKSLVVDPAQASTSIQQSSIVKSKKASTLRRAGSSTSLMKSDDEPSNDQTAKARKVSWKLNKNCSRQASVESNPITMRRNSTITSELIHSGAIENQLYHSSDNNPNTIKNKSSVSNKIKVSKRVIPHSMNSMVEMELAQVDTTNEMMVRTERKYVQLKEKYKLLEEKYKELQSEMTFRQQYDIRIKNLSKSIYEIIQIFEQRYPA